MKSDSWVSQRTMVSSSTNADISVPTRMICISCKKHFLAVVEIINVSTNSDLTNARWVKSGTVFQLFCGVLTHT